MTIHLNELLIALVVAAVIGWFADRRLRRTCGTRRPYRYGFFVAVLAAFATLSASSDVITGLSAGRLPVAALTLAVLGAGVTAGLAMRRRFGWWCLLSLLVLAGGVGVLLTGSRSATAFSGAAGVTILLLWLNALYARRRWPEFSSVRATPPDGIAAAPAGNGLSPSDGFHPGMLKPAAGLAARSDGTSAGHADGTAIAATR